VTHHVLIDILNLPLRYQPNDVLEQVLLVLEVLVEASLSYSSSIDNGSNPGIVERPLGKLIDRGINYPLPLIFR
jgi:hypothetical protein